LAGFFVFQPLEFLTVKKVIPILRCRNINTDVLTMKTFYIRFPVVENLAGFGCRIQTGHKLFSV